METISDFATLDEVIESVYGAGISLLGKRPVHGGDINRAYLLDLSGGKRVFLKENAKRNVGFFVAEAEGLQALAYTGAISVPTVQALGTYGDSAFLLMESIEQGPMKRDFWERFGHALADMHKAPVEVSGGSFGFAHDNYIGAGYQKNTPKDTWIEFFRDCRLQPQLDRARAELPVDTIRRIEHLMEKLDEYLVEPEHPSVLHGDLWSGNFMVGPDGDAWLIDPAAYVGCAEADIAMTELFGGFSGAFYGAYRESGLLMPGYEDRREIYNLYHMLNHLNLFGGSYLYAVERIAARF